ncbi:MAG TPA: WG repeat-containing protein [Cytophaga sp.]|nr:WG repeat-containing protein [Cytophaga sp.]
MKKRNVFVLFFVLLFSYASFAQTFIVQVKAASGKWGYVNLKGEYVIPAQFENCNPFAENGLAVVEKNKLNVIINTKGEEIPTEIKGYQIIQGAFGFAPKGFQDGLLAVQVNKKWGYLNATGKVAIPLKYEYVTAFESGFAAASVGTNFFVLDTKGTETPVKIPGILELKHFSEGFAPFKTADKKLGFVNGKGEIAIQPQFSNVGYFFGGYAWAKTAEGKVGFINTKGEWVIKPTFDGASDFDPVAKVARVKEVDTWLYVDVTGNKIYVKDTEVWGDFADGLAKGKQLDKIGFYDAKGVWVIKPQFEGVREFKNGYAAAKSGDKWGVIDTSGNWVIKPTFDGIKDVERIN